MDKTGTEIVVWAAKAWLHVTATLVIAACLGLIVADLASFDLFFAAFWHGGFEPDWVALSVHVALSGVVWGLGVGLFRLLARRQKQSNKQSIKLERARGTVVTETLIALVPFLLLTSGIAQYAMINVASILSDLAVYQAARTAWIWQPEADIGRNGVDQDDVVFRARTAAALTLAPTASSDFHVGRNQAPGSGPPFRRIRTAVAASFNPAPVSGEQFWAQTNQNWQFFGNTSMQATPENLAVNRAFDTDSFYMRAGRKVTSAWMCLEDFEVYENGDEVGVRFTYQYALLFPWFAYIFNDNEVIAQRDAHHLPIRREMTLTKQPGM